MGEELKPCPFCGEEGAEFQIKRDVYPDEEWFAMLYVECQHCLARAEYVLVIDGNTALDVYMEEAAKAWNTRVNG